jgi:hypothetical protein
MLVFIFKVALVTKCPPTPNKKVKIELLFCKATIFCVFYFQYFFFGGGGILSLTQLRNLNQHKISSYLTRAIYRVKMV